MRRALVLVGVLTGCPSSPAPEPTPSPLVEVPSKADVGTPELVTRPQDEVPDALPTDLPLALMATMVGDDLARGRATIRDEDANTIATLAVGDAVREGVVLAEVRRDAVLLTRGDATERLDFPLEPVPLRGDEALYPDFVDLDARTNTFDDAVQLQPGPGYMLKTPKHAWGTPRTVAAIQGALRRYVDRGLGGPAVHVGDISLQRGGPFPPHLSHQDGRDVDVGYVLQGELADVSRFVIASRGRLDVVRSWALLDAFLATDRVRYVFVDYALQRILYAYAKEQGVPQDRLDALFQYPRGSAAARGLIRHWRGHANHFHVRFIR